MASAGANTTAFGLARRVARKVYRTFVPPPPPGKDSQLNVHNFAAMRTQPPAVFEALRFDPNNDCNIHCVYCHNHRSAETISADDFESFLNENVAKVRLFQFGCVMEPTLDRRLADLMARVARSPARPTHAMMLQSNGILLNLHDPLKMRDAGLTELSISIDSADPGIQKSLRGGMKLERVLRNVDAFRAACPDIPVTFIATVTAENVGRMGDVVQMGLDRGVEEFVFREIFYVPSNDVVDHARMPALLLGPGQYGDMERHLRARFGARANMVFADQDRLDESLSRMKSDSFR